MEKLKLSRENETNIYIYIYTITYQQIYLMQQINIYNIWQNKIKTNDLLHYIDYTCTNIITIDPYCVKCKGWTNYTSNLSSTYVFEEFLGQCNHSNHRNRQRLSLVRIKADCFQRRICLYYRFIFKVVYPIRCSSCLGMWG